MLGGLTEILPVLIAFGNAEETHAAMGGADLMFLVHCSWLCQG